MILIGRNMSPFVRRTSTIMRLLEVKFEQRFLATADDMVEIKTINPLGRVPSLILDDGEILIDSSAIIDFILEAYDPLGTLLPKLGLERRKVLRTTAVAHGVMEKGVASSYEKTRRPKDKISNEWLRYVDAQIEQGLTELEKITNLKVEWLHGKNITVADVTVICAFDYISSRNPALVEKNNFGALRNLSLTGNAMDALKKTQHKDSQK